MKILNFCPDWTCSGEYSFDEEDLGRESVCPRCKGKILLEPEAVSRARHRKHLIAGSLYCAVGVTAPLLALPITVWGGLKLWKKFRNRA